jgi:hypothetical protein
VKTSKKIGNQWSKYKYQSDDDDYNSKTDDWTGNTMKTADNKEVIVTNEDDGAKKKYLLESG